MTDTIYQISGLRQRYTGPPVLDIGHLVIHRGRIIGLLDPNGSDKTALLAFRTAFGTEEIFLPPEVLTVVQALSPVSSWEKSAGQITARQIYPGRTIAVACDPADVSWLARET